MEHQEISQDSGQEDVLSSSDKPLTLGKFAFLGVLSIALYKFLPLAMLAPVPLIIAILLYGRSKTVFLAVISAALLWGLSTLEKQEVATAQYAMVTVIGYLLIYLNAVLVSEIVLRKLHPVKGLISAGMVVVTLTAGILAVYIMTTDIPIVVQLENTFTKAYELAAVANKKVLEEGGEKALMLKEMFSKPKEIAKEVVQWMPAMTFIGIYLGLYLCLMIVLRNSHFWKKGHVYPYTMKDLIKFEVPFQLIYFVILGLGLLLGQEYLGGESAKMVGSNILYCMAVFYFFQGFGIMLDFLTWLKVAGFFRSILVAVTLWSAWRMIVLIGLFDIWANFRKFLIKPKNKEGDIQ